MTIKYVVVYEYIEYHLDRLQSSVAEEEAVAWVSFFNAFSPILGWFSYLKRETWPLLWQRNK